MSELLKILQGDCRDVLKTLLDESVQCCVTSPPYYGLRDYKVDGQIGLEITPVDYIAKMVEVFRGVHRVLRDDGTLWLNLGDSYSQKTVGPRSGGTLGAWKNGGRRDPEVGDSPIERISGLGNKQLMGMPWRVALALQADGWLLRSDIIWSKPNPMPESVTDRPTKSHEYIFLLSKKPRYFYDAEAIKEKSSDNTHARVPGNVRPLNGQAAYENGDHRQRSKAGLLTYSRKMAETGSGVKNNPSFSEACCVMLPTRNKRDVWTVASQPYSEAHFATFPPDLIKPCILAGCPVGGTVLDPFGGSGTTGQVALELGRKAILIELNSEYVKLIEKRTFVTQGLALP